MPNIPRVGDLQIGQDLDHQDREWKVQRVGWVAMALLVLAGLLGLVGRGPLSSTSAQTADAALRVEYNRFVHYHNPEVLRLEAAPHAARGDELRLWLGREYLDDIQIQKVTPEPERVEAAADRHVYVFRIAESGGPTVVTFHYEPERRGTLTGQAGVAGGEVVTFWQFAYP